MQGNLHTKPPILLLLGWLSICIGLCQPAVGQEPLFKKYLNSDTDVVLWFDIASISSEELENLRNHVGPNWDDIPKLRKLFEDTKTSRIHILGNAAQMIAQGGMAIFETENPEALKLALMAKPDWAHLKVKVEDKHLLVSMSEASLADAVETAKSSEPQAVTPKLSKALQAYGGRVGAIIAFKPEFLRVVGSLPGANDSPDLANMITSISKLEFAIASQTGKDDDVKIEINFDGAEASQSFCRACNQFLKRSAKLPDDQPLFTTQGPQVILPGQSQRDLFARMMAQIKTGASEAFTMNQLRQLTLAFHNFESNYKKFPPQALCDAKGNKLLSWRVLILPFLNEQELYEQFKLDEPWDSEHNRQLISKIPSLYLSRDKQQATEQLKQGETCFVAPLTPDSVMGRPGDPLNFGNILDGTSNTILFVEVLPEQAVPWTKPDDWTVDFNDPLKGVVNENNKSFVASLIDGSVRKLPARINPATFKSLLTVDGGEVVVIPDEEESP